MVIVVEWQTVYDVGSSRFFVLLGKSDNLLQWKGIGNSGNCAKSVVIAKEGLDVMMVVHVVRDIPELVPESDETAATL